MPNSSSSRISIEELFRIDNLTEKLEFTDNLGEYESFIHEVIFQSDNDCRFLAGMNSGKTYTMLKIALGKSQQIEDSSVEPMVLAVPLRVIAQQKLKSLVEDFGNVPVRIVQGRYYIQEDFKEYYCFSEEEVQGAYERGIKIFMVVYDSIDKVIALGNEELSEFTFVIDEYHYLVSAFDHRRLAIKKIISAQNMFRNTVYLSGTPEGVFFGSEYLTYYFSNANTEGMLNQADINEIVIVPLTSDERFHEVRFRLLINIASQHEDEKVIIFINNKHTLKLLEKSLISCGIPEDDIILLSSDEKEKDSFQNVINNEKVSIDARIILTTSVISDGVNLYDEDIGALVIYDINDLILIRQMMGRFRKGLDRIYDLRIISNPTEELNVEVNNYKEEFRDYSNVINRYQDNSRGFERIERQLGENNKILANFNEEILKSTNTLSKYYRTTTNAEVLKTRGDNKYFNLSEERIIEENYSLSDLKEIFELMTTDTYLIKYNIKYLLQDKIYEKLKKEKISINQVKLIVDDSIYSTFEKEVYVDFIYKLAPQRIRTFINSLIDYVLQGFSSGRINEIIELYLSNNHRYQKVIKTIRYYFIGRQLREFESLRKIITRFELLEIYKQYPIIEDWVIINFLLNSDSTDDIRYQSGSEVKNYLRDFCKSHKISIKTAKIKTIIEALFETKSRTNTSNIFESKKSYLNTILGFNDYQRVLDKTLLSRGERANSSVLIMEERNTLKSFSHFLNEKLYDIYNHNISALGSEEEYLSFRLQLNAVTKAVK